MRLLLQAWRVWLLLLDGLEGMGFEVHVHYALCEGNGDADADALVSCSAGGCIA